MAAPPTKTLRDLNGQWVMNKSLSSDFTPLLALQGVSWLLRQALSYATITLSIHQYTAPPSSPTSSIPPTSSSTSSSPPSSDPPGITHIDISQTASGGITGTRECRTLDWTGRAHTDGVFGEVVGRSRWVGGAEGVGGMGGKEEDREGEGEGDREFLWGEGWEEGEHVQSWVVSEKGGWSANQIWGFEVIEGKRYYVRRVVVRKGEEVRRARLVYDFLG